jgi:nicotinamide-nucleotide amidase
MALYYGSQGAILSIMQAMLEETCKIIKNSLLNLNLTLAIAEATNCGLISYLLTREPESSRFVRGGISPYSKHSKLNILGISESLIYTHGSVSKEMALEMAVRVRTLFDSDLGLAETGIAGPSGGTPAKPAGLFYIALSNKNDEDYCTKHLFKENRDQTRHQSASVSLEMLHLYLSEL